MGQHRVGPSGEEDLGGVPGMKDRDQDAGSQEGRRGVQAAWTSSLEGGREQLQGSSGPGFDQVQASNETGVLCPQWGQTQT